MSQQYPGQQNTPGQYAQNAPAQQYNYQQQQPPPMYAQAVNPQGAYAAQPVQVVTQPTTYVVAGPLMLPRQSFVTTCPHCGASISTECRVTAGLCTWLSCAALCLVGCWFFCCLIPFVIPECQDCEHFCPNCRVLLGRRGPC